MPHPTHASRRAFSLFEVAVILVITSLVAGIAMKAYNSTGRIQCYAETQKKIDRVKEAVNRYMMSNDRFPLPAKRYLGITDPEYGKEVAQAEIGQLDTFDNLDNRVIYGALPFSTLNLSREDAVDCWGNKFTYVVSYVLTDKTKFLQPTVYPGKIKIFTEYAHVALDKPFLKDGGFAIISHGADGLGAVKENQSWPGTGGQNPRKWCFKDEARPIGHNNNELVSSDWSRYKNCLPRDGHLVSRPINDGKDAGGNFFDDIIAFRGPPYKISAPLPPDSNLYCWGANGSGQLGKGDNTPSSTPKPVKSKTTWVSAGVGQEHACATDIRGKLYCWGKNDVGQLGIGLPGGTKQLPEAVDVGSLPADQRRFVAVVGAGSSTCALTEKGSVYCWGSRLGAVGMDNKPQSIAFPERVISLAMSDQTACGVTVSGSIYCFGSDNSGAVGNGLPAGGLFPSPQLLDTTNVAAGSKFVSVTTTFETSCALTQFGKIYCWGRNAANYSTTHGTVANCDFSNSANEYCGRPVLVDTKVGVNPSDKFSKVSLGYLTIPNTGTYVFALDWDGNPYYWSVHDTFGPQNKTLLGGGALKFVDLKGTSMGTCGTTRTGAQHCWGYNSQGQLGNGGSGQGDVPVQVQNSGSTLKFDRMAAGTFNNCAILAPNLTPVGNTSQGSHLRCWGKIGSTTYLPTNPVTKPGGVGFWQNIFVGKDQACAIGGDLQGYCWSPNNPSFGHAGNFGITSPSSALPGGTVYSLATGSDHSCAVYSNGNGYCWGENDVSQTGRVSASFETPGSGALGATIFGDVHSSSAMSIPLHQTSISEDNGCYISVTGNVLCSGENNYGEHGNGTTTSSTEPTLSIMPGGVSAFREVETYGSTTCATGNDGLVYCWGLGDEGQLGTGSNTNSTAPVPVNFLSLGPTTTDAFVEVRPAVPSTLPNVPTRPFETVRVGDRFACAVDYFGMITCWGHGNEGQLGNNMGATSYNPVIVGGASPRPHNIHLFDIGKSHGCFGYLSGGFVYPRCWGTNAHGEGGRATGTALGPTDTSFGADLRSISAGDYGTCATANF